MQGQDRLDSQAVLATNLILCMLSRVGSRINEARKIEDQFHLVVFSCFIIHSCILSLRGVEGMMVNLSMIIKCRTKSEDAIVIGLKRKMKGKANKRVHLFYCIKETSSGIKVQHSVGQGAGKS